MTSSTYHIPAMFGFMIYAIIWSHTILSRNLPSSFSTWEQLLRKDDLTVKAAERHSREALLLTSYMILTEQKNH